MNKSKKVGLTALAGSLVVTSAVAGEMSVSGGASIGLKNTTKTSSGRSWTMIHSYHCLIHLNQRKLTDFPLSKIYQMKS